MKAKFPKFVTGIRAAGLAGVMSVGVGAGPVQAVEVTVYKSPTCGCCSKWVEHMRDNGFEVKTTDVTDLRMVKSMSGVKPEFASCHTAMVDGYVVEGHVPADDVKRLLEEKPPVAGIAVPGMPMGSPGMEGPRTDPYNVISFDRDGNAAVFERH